MDLVFLEYLKQNLNKEMKEIEKDSPTISYLSKCTKQIKTHESYLTTFKITFSKTKGKIKNNLKSEEKLKISNGKFSTKGTILFVEEDEVIIELASKIDFGDYTLDRITNYNNEIIFKNLESYKKDVPVEILQGWIENLKIRIYDKFSVRLQNDKEVFDFLNNNIQLKNTPLKNTPLKNTSLENTSMKNTSLEISDEERISKIANIIDKIINYDHEITPSYSENKITLISFYDDFLNESQKSAICEILNKKSYKIVGPPGTGKTRTVVEILSQLLYLGHKVLVAGPSNITIDNIIERFLNSKYYAQKKTSFYRLGSSLKGLTKFNLDSQISQMTSFVEKEKNERNFKRNLEKMQKKYKKDLQEESPLVFATLFSSLKEKVDFDWVIIDEACQASEIESFLTLVKGKNFILIGDPNQLCPKSTSIFEKLTLKTFLLNLQYRMCPNLISFSNVNFYNKKILSFKNESYFLIHESPVVFIDTDCSDLNEVEEDCSKKNQGEADIILKILDFLPKDPSCIGIITPYSAQAALLRNNLPEGIEIKTVDGFQGREKDFIILSLVRSNNLGEYGFLDDYKRSNVAITRSKKGLIVVGNSQNFRKSEFFSKFFKYIEENFVSLDPMEIEEYFVKRDK